jgi:hypothetical protein
MCLGSSEIMLLLSPRQGSHLQHLLPDHFVLLIVCARVCPTDCVVLFLRWFTF